MARYSYVTFYHVTDDWCTVTVCTHTYPCCGKIIVCLQSTDKWKFPLNWRWTLTNQATIMSYSLESLNAYLHPSRNDLCHRGNCMGILSVSGVSIWMNRTKAQLLSHIERCFTRKWFMYFRIIALINIVTWSLQAYAFSHMATEPAEPRIGTNINVTMQTLSLHVKTQRR